MLALQHLPITVVAKLALRNFACFPNVLFLVFDEFFKFT